MKNSILTKLTWLVTIVVLISLFVISFTNYEMTYYKVKEAAGIELIGCANITTGLLTSEDISKLKNLTPTEVEQLNEKISWTAAHKPIFEDQYILSLDGSVLVADENLQEQGIQIGDSFPISTKVIEEIKNEKKPVYSDVYTFAGMKRLTGYAPIFKDHDPNKELIAISSIDFDAKILTERTWSMVQTTIIVGVISLLLAGVAIILFVRKTILPLKHLNSHTKKISEGDLTTGLLELKASGEIHELNISFNQMVSNLRESLLFSSGSSKEIAASSEQLNVNASEVTHLLEDVSYTFQNVADSITHQAGNLSKMKTTFGKITENTDTMTKRILTATEHSQNVLHKVSEGSELIQDSIHHMKTIQSKTDNLSSAMGELNEKSAKVREILNMITNISKQTNLLALNASIESARAGEHGKGFAVVANEIRGLAEETAKSINNIATIVQEIEEKTTEAVTLTIEGNETAKVGMNKVEEAGKTFTEINDSIKISNHDVNEILQGVTEINRDIQNANSDVELIEKITSEISDSTQTVAASSQQQTASMEEISSSIQMLASMANQLEKISSKFKL